MERYAAFMENKIRFKFTKRLEFKYLSHLDMVRLIERALRRAGIKLKYSQGYNPRPLISFSPPVPLGVESFAEYGDLSADCPISSAGFIEKVNSQLESHLEIIQAEEIPAGTKNLMADIAVVQYRFFLRHDESRDIGIDMGITPSFGQALSGLLDDSSFAPSIFRMEIGENKDIGEAGIKTGETDMETVKTDMEIGKMRMQAGKTEISNFSQGYVLNLYGYATIFKEKENKIFKLNDFLVFLKDWLGYNKTEITGAFKVECFVAKEKKLVTPFEAACLAGGS